MWAGSPRLDIEDDGTSSGTVSYNEISVVNLRQAITTPWLLDETLIR